MIVGRKRPIFNKYLAYGSVSAGRSALGLLRGCKATGDLSAHDDDICGLFAKKDRANISPDELAEFKKLAEAYGRMTAAEADAAVRNRDLLEICHDP